MKVLAQKVAVVTGAGSGIGRATAMALANKGCELALADINVETLKETANQLRDIGTTVSEHVVNVGSLDEMKRFVAEVEQQHQTVDILINNAGIGIHGEFINQSIEQLQRIVDINMWGVVYGCKLFLPLLMKQDESHIVNISSAAGINPSPGMASYSMTKFAVRGLSESIRIELKKYNVGVTSVHPGVINTNIPMNTEYENIRMREKGKAAFEKYGHSPEKAAGKIVKAIEKNQQRVLIGPEAYIMDAAKRAFPVYSDKAFELMFKNG